MIWTWKTQVYLPCDQAFTLAHALYCPSVGCIQIRQNEILKNFAKLMEVHYDVKIESHLETLRDQSFDQTTKTDDTARIEIKAVGIVECNFQILHRCLSFQHCRKHRRACRIITNTMKALNTRNTNRGFFTLSTPDSSHYCFHVPVAPQPATKRFSHYPRQLRWNREPRPVETRTRWSN